DGLDRVGLEEARRDDQVGALAGDAALALGGGVGRALELDDLDLEALGLEVGGGALDAAPRALVERPVELAAGVVDDADHVVLSGGGRDEERGQQDEQSAHVVSSRQACELPHPCGDARTIASVRYGTGHGPAPVVNRSLRVAGQNRMRVQSSSSRLWKTSTCSRRMPADWFLNIAHSTCLPRRLIASTSST